MKLFISISISFLVTLVSLNAAAANALPPGDTGYSNLVVLRIDYDLSSQDAGTADARCIRDVTNKLQKTFERYRDGKDLEFKVLNEGRLYAYCYLEIETPLKNRDYVFFGNEKLIINPSPSIRTRIKTKDAESISKNYTVGLFLDAVPALKEYARVQHGANIEMGYALNEFFDDVVKKELDKFQDFLIQEFIKFFKSNKKIQLLIPAVRNTDLEESLPLSDVKFK